jgi:asparagine synthase (glutamine-hydrolysing)
MCGIAGWVSYDRDLTAERAAIEAMTQTMSCRGPDADGIWLDTHVALGHRRLAVIDIDGGAQPMAVSHEGRTVLVVTYSGEVYNYRELRAELAARGHAFKTSSDTEVVLHAYLEWGEDFSRRLNGIYAFALWEPRDQQLLLVRDRLGVKPLYYFPTRDGVLFGSEPKAILAHPQAQAVIDAEGLTELFAYTVTPGRSIYAGMRELRPGHLLRVRREGLTPRQYWRLEGHEHTDSLDATVSHVRELLEDIVARQLVADVPVCTLLSGGLDSSALTALAANAQARARGGPVRSYAVDFAGHGDAFAADGLRATPDGPYARALARHVGTEHQAIVLDTAMLTDRANRDAVLAAHDAPYGRGEGDTSLYLLFKAVRERSTVALSGESADEVFGGYVWFHDQQAVTADTFPWLTPRAAANFGGFGRREILLEPGLLRKLDVPGYRAERYHDALAEVPHADEQTGLERRMREISYLALTRFMRFLLDRKDRMSMAVGLEVRVPFCDHRLVEYVFNAPWSMKTFDGREKSLLRAATADLLPPSIANRVKSPYPSTQDPGYARAIRAEFGRLLRDPRSPVLPLLDPVAAQRAAAPDSATPRAGLEIMLDLDRLLRTHDVHVKI